MFVGRDEEIAPGDRWWQGDVTEDGETGLLCPNCVAIRQEHAEEES
jgi:hypothetical protein